MAGGFAKDGAVQDQIDATVEDAVKRARSNIPRGESLRKCEECDADILKHAGSLYRACVCASTVSRSVMKKKKPTAGLNHTAVRTVSCGRRLPRRSQHNVAVLALPTMRYIKA